MSDLKCKSCKEEYAMEATHYAHVKVEATGALDEIEKHLNGIFELTHENPRDYVIAYGARQALAKIQIVRKDFADQEKEISILQKQVASLQDIVNKSAPTSEDRQKALDAAKVLFSCCYHSKEATEAYDNLCKVLEKPEYEALKEKIAELETELRRDEMTEELLVLLRKMDKDCEDK